MMSDFLKFYVDQWRKHGTNDQKVTVTQRKAVATIVSSLFDELGVKSVLDAPCGDFEHYMQFVDLDDRDYIGYDINPHSISRNIKFAPQYKFVCADIVECPLPVADAVLCRWTTSRRAALHGLSPPQQHARTTQAIGSKQAIRSGDSERLTSSPFRSLLASRS